MAKRIKIEFVTNPSAAFTSVAITYGVNSYTLNLTIGGTIAIGATKELTALNYFTFVNSFAFPAWLQAIITPSLSGGIVWLDFTVANEADLSFPTLLSTTSAITIQEVDTPSAAAFKIGLVRSTLSLRVIPNINFDKATLDLYNWSGNIAAVPAVTSYSLSKPVVQLGQTVINFDINELAKTGISPTISNYTQSGVQPIPHNQSCWSYYTANCYDGTTLVYTVTGLYLCLYGYGYFQELYNPVPVSNVLIDGNNHTHLRGYDNRIHFLTRGLTSVTVNGTAVAVTLNTDFNYNNVVSLNLNDYDTSATTITVVFTYTTETRTVVYSVKDECKYEVVNCVFINKYGLPQSFFFTKAQKRNDEIDSSEYRGLISDFGVYNTTAHTFKTFNSNGRSKVVCNSDYLNENQNATFRQLMLSESIWLIESGVINPVTIDKKSIEYKTSLVDKLIQYSIDFKYSFDIINQC